MLGLDSINRVTGLSIREKSSSLGCVSVCDTGVTKGLVLKTGGWMDLFGCGVSGLSTFL